MWVLYVFLLLPPPSQDAMPIVAGVNKLEYQNAWVISSTRFATSAECEAKKAAQIAALGSDPRWAQVTLRCVQR